MDKLLTVVVPVYNTEKYLMKCLDSLIVPEYMERLDVIIVIDGSPDHSIDIARKYEERYPQTFYVIDKENGGHGSCCNVGLKEAKGKYIRFLDSDDWFDDEDFYKFLNEINCINADLIQTNQTRDYVYKGKSVKENEYEKVANQLWDADEFDYMSFCYFITLANSTFRTMCLRETEVFFTEKTPFDDTILYIQPLQKIRTIYCLNLKVYHYFIGRPGQSVRKMNERKILCMRNEYMKLCNSYLCIRKEMSVAKVNYADRFLNNVISGGFYECCFSLPYSLSKEYLRDWTCYVDNLPFINSDRISYYVLYKKYPFPLVKLIAYSYKVWNKIKFIMA